MKTMTVLISILFSFSLLAWTPEAEFMRNCKTCHTIGGGDKVGPDLGGLSKRRDAKWIGKFMAYPDGMVNGDADEPGYEKPDALAKGLFALYKKSMMTEQEWATDAGKVKQMMAYIDSRAKAPKAGSKIICFEKELKATKSPAKAAAKCKK